MSASEWGFLKMGYALIYGHSNGKIMINHYRLLVMDHDWPPILFDSIVQVMILKYNMFIFTTKLQYK